MVGRHRPHTGLKTRCRANCKQRGAGSDSSLFAICYGDRGTAKREVPCFPFHHKRHGPRIGSGGRPQAWPHVMLSEQTRHRFHSCRAIVGKEGLPPHSVPELQPYNHRQDAPSRHIVLHQKPRPSIQAWTASSEALEEKRWPSSQVPVPAASASSLPLSPKSELEEVQKGITVFPVKSLASTKPSTGHAAIPHQIGN